jgi:hypothetical protein
VCDDRNCFGAQNKGTEMKFLISCRAGATIWMAIAICFLLLGSTAVFAQQLNDHSVDSQPDDVEEKMQQFISCGEFPAAIVLAQSLPNPNGDLWLQKVASAQSQTGALNGAFATTSLMDSDVHRTNSLQHLSAYERGFQTGDTNGAFGGSFGGNGPAQSGGISANDFVPLMDLIQGTIQTESWLATGTGEGTIQPFPSGVFVNGEGVLQRIAQDKTKKLAILKQNLRGAADKLSGATAADVLRHSDLRKVSLTELEKQAQLLAARGKPLTESMRNLAGLTEIKYVMMYPDSGEIVIAGPAGAWESGQEERVVNAKTGDPVLQLDDLVVCLRNAFNDGGKFGCAIVPREKNLAATKKFLATSKLTGAAWRKELQKTLALQDIDVFGIDGTTHAAHVLVEADYRMKLIGMGLEPSINEIPSYLDRVELDANGNPPPMDVVRWWFTLSYDNVLANESRDLFAFSGPGVKVLSETEFINDAGQRIHTGNSVGPTKAFAEDFTEHFDLIAAEYPIYKELKNVFDLAIVANLIRDQNLAKRADWRMTFFTDPAKDQFVTVGGKTNLGYPMQLTDSPMTVNTVMNHRVIKERRKGVTRKHTLVGVSGGVSFNAYDAMAKDKIVTEDDVEFLQIKDDAKSDMDAVVENRIAWWWD